MSRESLSHVNVLRYCTQQEVIDRQISNLEKLKSRGLVFPPSPDWLFQEMQSEWELSETTRNEWAYVQSTIPQILTEIHSRVRDQGHQGMSLIDFLHHPTAIKAQLLLVHVIALRLYTGPGYSIWNGDLRSGGSSFLVSTFVLDWAVVKLALINENPFVILYRGLKGRLDPKIVRMLKAVSNPDTPFGTGEAWDEQVSNFPTDLGFMSTSDDENVATGPYGGDTLFSFISFRSPDYDGAPIQNGGQVSWVSQFPSESEVLFPSNTVMIPSPEEEKVVKLMAGTGKDVFFFTLGHPYDPVTKIAMAPEWIRE
eukprot:c14623_g1_i1.p1 GENE.c14623_g1_i1~~c14623_g1_i1.p1  ORF type:complete len:311 (+),score=76.10 c14623_g1_i1:47-979(+)